MDTIFNEGLGISLDNDVVATILTSYIMNNAESDGSKAVLDGIYKTSNFYSFFTVSRYML